MLCGAPVRALASVGNMAALQHGGRYGTGIEHMARDSPVSPFRWRARARKMTCTAEKFQMRTCVALMSVKPFEVY